MRGFPLRGVVSIFVMALAGGAFAATLEYPLEVEDDAPVAIEVPFEVVYPGKIIVEARWNSPRILLLRVEGPGSGVLDRRSGPSPQRVELSTDLAASGTGIYWRVVVRGLAARGAASGTLFVTVPDDPKIVRQREEAAKPKPTPPPPPDPWTVRREAPAGAPPELALVFQRVESLRGLVFPMERTSPTDACGWQVDTVRAMTDWRDEMARGKTPLTDATLRYLARLARAVRSVDSLRTSSSPILAGPVPDDPLRRRAWTLVRRDELASIERQLDVLLEQLHGGFVPDLERAPWPPRLIACLTACERFFDERVTSGLDGASNRAVADAQWDRIVATAAVLEALSSRLPESASAR